MSKKTVIEYPAESNPEDSDILYLIKGLTDRNITLRKIKDYILGSINRTVKDSAETDSGTLLTANGVNELIARVGKLYVQYPFMPTPDEFYSVGTWLNISTRAVGYGISDSNDGDPTSYISREDAGQGMDFADTDLVVGDQITGGVYDGKYVRSVESYSGDFFRVEGTNALSFNTGRQLDAMQRITGVGRFSPRIVTSIDTTGVFSRTESVSNEGPASGTISRGDLKFDNANSISPNIAKTDDIETRSVNRSNRIWIRTA
ncbi:MAG: hypothetical protein PQJ58_17215 [Spirochaetales bacterium]|nr:hypothetical protein [Spirochaetales bacterium]